MIRRIALLIFGWKRTPERLVARGADMIAVCLRDFEVERADTIPRACLLKLSYLAYERARKGSVEEPRFIYFARQLEKIGTSVAVAISGQQIRDEQVRDILFSHGAMQDSKMGVGVRHLEEPDHATERSE